MRKVILVCFVVSIVMVACGPDSELVNSGISHSCTIKRLTEERAENPADKELEEEYIRTVGYLTTVIEMAGDSESDREEGAKDCE